MSYIIKHCAKMEPGYPPDFMQEKTWGKEGAGGKQTLHTATLALQRGAHLGVRTSRQSNPHSHLGEYQIRERFLTNAYRSLS